MTRSLTAWVFLVLVTAAILTCDKNKSPLIDEPSSGAWEFIADVGNEFSTIYFLDSMTGWVIGGHGSIKKTMDGGFHWTTQESGTTNNLSSINFLDQRTGFVTGGNQTLLRTTNGGESWEAITVDGGEAKIFGSLHADRDGYVYFITNFGEIFSSGNLGRDWNRGYSFNEWGYSYLNMRNTPVGFAMQLFGNRIQKTTDNGKTWRNLPMPSPWTGSTYFLNARYGWTVENWLVAATIPHDSVYVYTTQDGGETWEWRSSLPGVLLSNLVFVDDRQGWVSDIDTIYETTDGGRNWSAQFQSTKVGYYINIFFYDKYNGSALTSQGKIIKYSAEQF